MSKRTWWLAAYWSDTFGLPKRAIVCEKARWNAVVILSSVEKTRLLQVELKK